MGRRPRNPTQQKSTSKVPSHSWQTTAWVAKSRDGRWREGWPGRRPPKGAHVYFIVDGKVLGHLPAGVLAADRLRRGPHSAYAPAVYADQHYALYYAPCRQERLARKNAALRLRMAVEAWNADPSDAAKQELVLATLESPANVGYRPLERAICAARLLTRRKHGKAAGWLAQLRALHAEAKPAS